MCGEEAKREKPWLLELILGTSSLIPGGVRGAGWVGLALAFSCLPTNRDLAKDEQMLYLVVAGLGAKVDSVSCLPA